MTLEGPPSLPNIPDIFDDDGSWRNIPAGDAPPLPPFAVPSIEDGPLIARQPARSVSTAEQLPNIPANVDLPPIFTQGDGEEVKTLQTGGKTLTNATLKALALTKEQGKTAIEGLKKDLGLRSDFHGKIMSNGDLVNPNTNDVLGNLFDYLH